MATKQNEAAETNLGSHGHGMDDRNASVLFDVNGELVPRERAVVSVFDSGFILGDGIWEGLRLKGGRIAFLERHLDRVFNGARAIDLDIGLTRDELRARIQRVIDANKMTDGVHIRLMVTRGEKATPYQDPRVVISAATIVILAEYKNAPAEAFTAGLSLFTVHVRRGRPDVQDPRLNTHSK
ncbi:MAG: aminotransferase class IV, partial [Planctomycetota bacterium]|nr:aminotransferase class IV [Planctomycetota bacterium]